MQFWPPIESTGGLCVRSTEITTPVTVIGTATDWPFAPTAEMVIVELPSSSRWPVLLTPFQLDGYAPGCTVPVWLHTV